MARTHRQKVEAAKKDAIQTPYDHINKIGFIEAWKIVSDNDAGLPKEPPECHEDAKRAIIGLARWVEQLLHEWS